LNPVLNDQPERSGRKKRLQMLKPSIKKTEKSLQKLEPTSPVTEKRLQKLEPDSTKAENLKDMFPNEVPSNTNV